MLLDYGLDSQQFHLEIFLSLFGLKSDPGDIYLTKILYINKIDIT